MTDLRCPLAAPVLGLVSALLLTGCGPETGLDLDLRSVAVTVPRLVTPAIDMVPAAPALPPVALPVVPLPPLPVLLAPPPPPLPSLPAAPTAPACPKAGPFAVPERPEALIVTTPPAAGVTTFLASGSHSSTSGEGSLAGPVRTTTTALPSATSSTGQRVDAWQVERSAASRTSVELYQLVHPSDDPRATAAGVYLVGMAWQDPVRGDLMFRPEGGGVQVLPVPVQLSAATGAQYVGSATDPATLTTLSIVRNVTGRERIDLCGEVVDTFTVEMTGTLTTPGTQRQLTWTQQYATAYGPANVDESLTLSSAVEGFTWTRGLRATEVPAIPKATS